jgi:dihydropteroate synthase
MGVINVTPDSFYDGGRFLQQTPDLPRIVDCAAAMLAEGASILDLGGESTRPGAAPVTEEEELQRVLPVLERLLELDAIVSLDTSKAAVAARGLQAGVHMINDVTGAGDPQMLETIADSGAALCLMHMQGKPRTMQDSPYYADVVSEVRDFLASRVAACTQAGIGHERLLLDPGFGFGKTLEHNLYLLQGLDALRVHEDLALLVGMSRKGMIGTMTGRPLQSRMAGSVAAALLAAQRGADIVRVHDVAETADALNVLAALEGLQTEGWQA